MAGGKKKALALLLAEFFYLGRFPFAPGTMGSLGSLVIWIPSVFFSWPLSLKLIILLLLFLVGGWASAYGIKHYRISDPKQVVIDEVVGQGIPFLVVDLNLTEIILAFFLFRFFDILKPWPIRALESRFQDHWGIMIDDIVAGIFAMAIIFIGKALIF